MDEKFVLYGKDVSEELVSSEEIIKVVFEACPQIALLPRLLYLDLSIMTTNRAIVRYLECIPAFEAIIQRNFIPVYEKVESDFYFMGYLPNTPENEKATVYIWDFPF